MSIILIDVYNVIFKCIYDIIFTCIVKNHYYYYYNYYIISIRIFIIKALSCLHVNGTAVPESMDGIKVKVYYINYLLCCPSTIVTCSSRKQNIQFRNNLHW